MTALAWRRAKNVLCVRLDSLGDLLMTTPAIRALRDSGARRITVLTSSSGAKAARLVPEVDEVLVYDPPWMKATHPRKEPTCDAAMICELQRRRFDAAVVFTVFSQNPLPAAMLCYLAATPLRLAHCRENPYQLLTNWVPDPEPQQGIRHEVRRQLDLVATIGATTRDERLSLEVSGAHHAAVPGLLEKAGINPFQPWMVVHPGATAPSRRYSTQQFGEVIQLLVRKHGFQILISGTGGEGHLVEEVRLLSHVKTASLAGMLSLGEFAAILASAPLLISNNSGPVHIAAAVGTPVVDLYALTNPQHTPWQVPCRVLSYDVPCRNCFRSICPEGHHECLSRIQPAAVVRAALELLEECNSDVRTQYLERLAN
jgi:lipopolysaccharide heptosyltransferase II